MLDFSAPPNFPTSSDALALLGDDLDYDFAGRIAGPYAFWLDWKVPALGVLFYLVVSEPLFDAVRGVTGGVHKGVVFAHNVALAAYSGWSAFYTWRILFAAIARSGFRGMHCDRDVWRGADGFGTFAVIFYVSKYYEFVDSWILVLKNSDGKHAPSFLQKYHHAGIVVCMYAAVVSEANWMLIAVTFNCTIHFFMYSYYAAATLGYKSPLAKLLTTCQMLQFIIGIVSAGACYFYDPCAGANKPAQLACGLTQVYAAGLIYLFNEMRKRKYGKRA
ncbi:fatty acid elongation [Aureococcus anophagefferens]|uniref:Elongation of fatty acids protein n=1 Tax=Aureococcus anophagefferens TaxID=44056 RepID=A0ABR1GAL3_AURAN